MKKPPLIWLNVILFTVTFLLAVLVTPWYGFSHGLSAGLWWAMLATVLFAGLSITAGYHRLWSHRAYDAHPIVRVLWMIGGTLALQNSILHWASDHREHHKHVDHDDHDPYSASRGFWFSHIGWMLRHYQANRYHDYGNVKDLQKDPIVMFQHRYYLPLVLVLNFGWPLLIGWLLNDVVGALLLVGVVRIVINHHTTFFINSLAHIWGGQPYTDRNSARDNGFLALLTYGEGYHNYHHIFSNDYRNGIRWWQFDPTKWLIRACSWLGLASNLKRCSGYQIEKAKLTMQFKRYQARYEAKQPTTSQVVLERLQHDYEQVLQKLKAYYQARKVLLDSKTARLRDHVHADIDQLKHQAQELRSAFQLHRKRWRAALAEQLA
ncbi:acyl-CoA desaturase [Idiomarina xiamenensis]|nr:fatty acid desaturase [Idiomarina xiamenensis]